MYNISLFLNKYSQIGLKERQIKQSIIEAIKKVCGLDIEEEKIKIEGKNLLINVQGPIKSEIFINLEEIQEEFRSSLKEKGQQLDQKKFF
jgi:hypothetical protein